MALKDLLVCVDGRERSLACLRLAADLARRNGSFLTALYAQGWSPAQLTLRRTAELAGRPLGEMQSLASAIDESIDRSALQRRSQLEQLAVRYGLPVRWEVLEAEVAIALPQHARYADLCILAVDTPAESTPAGYRFSEEMLFTAGRPVLLVPATGEFDALGAHIADRLQEQALAAGADLMVAGAHGHTWLREVLLGSVTRDLLARLRLPLMMSH